MRNVCAISPADAAGGALRVVLRGRGLSVHVRGCTVALGLSFEILRPDRNRHPHRRADSPVLCRIADCALRPALVDFRG